MASKKSIRDGIQQEKRLIEWMRRDLHAGFNGVVEAYQRYLLWVADGVLGDTPRLAYLVEDVVQDGLLNAFLYLDAHPELLEDRPGDKRFKLKAWLTTIVQHQALKCLVKGEAHIIINAGVLGEEIEEVFEEGYVTHYDDPMLFIERLESIKEAKRLTRQLLSNLSPEQRIAIEYKYLTPLKPGQQKITDEQVANVLGEPVATVKKRVSRAKKQMREQLSRQVGQEENQSRKLS
jgi:RNA polymerase sigma factor (sigma-70 family)